ncbi:MAG: SPASM domain-containing protein [Paludibacteraceae bacterium]|nr:SPASM domain-containing protein [Paludibacteraceae bacterium]
MRFKKIYIEITNVCNFNCSFCFPSSRPKSFMSVDDFSLVLDKIKPYTEYIYLHVLGEPLLHPRFGQVLQTAFDKGFKVNVTTNGSLLHKLSDLPDDLIRKVRQFNISFHDAVENVPSEQWGIYFERALGFVNNHAGHCLFSLRFWNEGADGVSDFNRFCVEQINKYLSVDLDPSEVLSKRSTTIGAGLFIHNAARFRWPGQVEVPSVVHSCYALRDHLAILADGSVVPCCLDADANIKLGNIFSDDFESVFSSPRAEAIRQGFLQHKAVESLCQHCGFIMDK